MLNRNTLIATYPQFADADFFSLDVESNEDKVLNVKHSIGKYLPIYGIWFAIVIFILPLLFS